jgi:Tol biopolymer transport system component
MRIEHGCLHFARRCGILTRMAVRVLILAWVLAGLGLGARAAQPPAVRETPLGNMAGYDAIKALTLATNCSHLGFVGVKGDKQYLVMDGVESPPYDWIIPDSLSGPMDLSRLGFLIQNGNEIAAVVDGKTVGSGYYSVGGDRISFSADGRHYAYTARRGTAAGDKAFVVRDGVEAKPYPAVEIIPVLSPDGNHVAYMVSLGGGKMCVIRDQAEQKAYDQVLAGTILFSPDSQRLAYTASIGGKFVTVIDGQESKPYDGMRMTPIFSADSKRTAYIGSVGTQFVPVIDGVEGPSYDRFTDGSLVFSPDSLHIAYAARKGKQWQLVLDGKPQQPYEAIIGGAIHFSPDSAHIAYVAAVGTLREVVVDGKVQKPVDEVLWPGPIFSPDSKRLAYLAARTGQAVVFTDETDGAPYDSIADLEFSPDSKHVAYRALAKSRSMVVMDGKESPPVTATTPVVFSPDGGHWVVAVLEGAATTIQMDGVDVGKSYTSWVNGARPTFTDPGTANFLMVRDKQYLHVEVPVMVGARSAAEH